MQTTQVKTYEDEAYRFFPEGCKCGNNGGGDCDWCQVYYGYDKPWMDEEGRRIDDARPRESQSSKHCDAGYMNDARFGDFYSLSAENPACAQARRAAGYGHPLSQRTSKGEPNAKFNRNRRLHRRRRDG